MTNVPKAQDKFQEILERSFEELSEESTGAQCLTAEEIMGLAGSDLSRIERARVQSHMSLCTACLSKATSYWEMTAADRQSPVTSPARLRFPALATRSARLVPALAAAAALLLMVGVGSAMYRLGKDDGLRLASAHALLYDMDRDAEDLEELGVRTTRSSVIDAVKQVRVFTTTIGNETYPFLTGHDVSPAELERLRDGLRESWALREEYDAYLRHWADVCRRFEAVLVDSGTLSGAIEVHDYLARHPPPARADGTVDGKHLDTLLALGELHERNGDYRAALDIYRDIIDRGLAPSDPRPAKYAGRAAHGLGDLDAARRYYDASLAIDPRNVRALFGRSLVHRDAGRRDLYRTDLDASIELGADAYARTDRARGELAYDLAVMKATRGRPADLNAALVDLDEALEWTPAYGIPARHEPSFQAFLSQATHRDRFRSSLDQSDRRAGVWGVEAEPTYDPSPFDPGV